MLDIIRSSVIPGGDAQATMQSHTWSQHPESHGGQEAHDKEVYSGLVPDISRYEGVSS